MSEICEECGFHPLPNCKRCGGLGLSSYFVAPGETPPHYKLLPPLDEAERQVYFARNRLKFWVRSRNEKELSRAAIHLDEAMRILELYKKEKDGAPPAEQEVSP